MTFGQFVKSLRSQQNLGLREFCLQYKHDPSNWSKIERGILAPPKAQEILEEMAAQLGLKKGDSNWFVFFDLASVAQGVIPDDILSDEALVQKLPIFFRTIRGEKPTKEELKALAALLLIRYEDEKKEVSSALFSYVFPAGGLYYAEANNWALGFTVCEAACAIWYLSKDRSSSSDFVPVLLFFDIKVFELIKTYSSVEEYNNALRLRLGITFKL
jgi:transcriptional regulator with XRE-family HTH domain